MWKLQKICVLGFRRNLGCAPYAQSWVFFQNFQLFHCFIIQLVKKLQQWSFYEVIEDILPFVLNTKRPLSNIIKTVLGVFKEIQKVNFFEKHPKLFCLYLSNQILLRGRFVFKTNGRTSSIISHKDHCCSFFTSWVIKRQKSCILNILKKHPTLGVWCTPPKYFSEFYKLFLGFYKS